jgi:hypothetical protein
MPLDIHQLKQLGQLDQRAKSGQMTSEDRQLLMKLIESHIELVSLLKDPNTSLDDVYQYLSPDGNETAIDDAASDRSESLPQDRDE